MTLAARFQPRERTLLRGSSCRRPRKGLRPTWLSRYFESGSFPVKDFASNGLVGLFCRGVVVHLVDGTYELFRHFYGLRRFTKGKDRPYGAVVGVLPRKRLRLTRLAR